MKLTAIYPGTFDPPTYGHIDVIKRARRICGELIVAIADSDIKDIWFSVDERMKMLKGITKGMPGVRVDSFKNLLVNYACMKRAGFIIRGLRALSDFEYEFQMALTNRTIAPEIETVFMMPRENYSYLSSSLIKEIASLGGSVKKFVPSVVEKALKSRLKKRCG